MKNALAVTHTKLVCELAHIHTKAKAKQLSGEFRCDSRALWPTREDTAGPNVRPRGSAER